MSVARVEKVHILFERREHARVIERLQDLGYVQINDLDTDQELLESVSRTDASEAVSRVDYTLAGIRFSIDYLSPYESKEGSALDRLVGSKPSFSREDIRSKIEKTDFDTIVKEVQDLETAINRVDNESAAFAAERVLIEPWKSVPFVVSRDQGLVDYDFRLVSGLSGLRDAILKKASEEDIEVAADIAGSDGKLEYVSVIATRDSLERIDQFFVELGAEVAAIEDMQVTVSERLSQIEAYQSRFETERGNLEKRAVELTKHLSVLRVGFDYFTWERERIGAFARSGETTEVAVLVAWVEADKLKGLAYELADISANSAVVPVSLEEEEEPPVIMRNKKWAAPFEAITGIYGSPGYNEPDPTPWLTPFFVIFFGLCLTDVGYGIFLALLAGLALKFMAGTDESKKLMKVLVVGGLATAVLGALFGGWMGIAIDELPASGIKDFLVGIRLVDPIANPIAVLLLSFVLGIIQVIVGLFVNLKWQLKYGDKKEALLGSGVWMVFLLVLIAWVLAKASVLPASTESILTNVVLAAVVLVVLSGTRKTKNWFLKLPIGILGLYDLVGYFSDVLSYSRLLALGLGTGIIAMVVNLIASLAVEMIPVVGWVFFVLILIGGHLFNIAINVLGAYIHSSRLQFVEFFPKFMEGGGKVFVPFRKETKYISLEK